MTNKDLRLRNSLLDWQNEKAYHEKRLEMPDVPEETKAYSRKRIDEANSNVKLIIADMEETAKNEAHEFDDTNPDPKRLNLEGEECEVDCGGIKSFPILPEGRPRKLKDGSFKWGSLRFANERELMVYTEEYFKRIPIID